MAKQYCWVRWIKVGLVVSFLTFVFLEFLVRVVPIEEKTKSIFWVEPMAATKAQPWFDKWGEDHNQLRRTFQSYEIYRQQPYRGKYINISPEGYRHTLNQGNPEREELIRVGVFGGSTLWGSWVRDNYTIPSILSARLRDKFPKTAFDVVNYGEIGFVFSQELHRAVRILYSDAPLESPAPRIMIFFDGVNDVLSSISNFTQGITDPAGLPWEYSKFSDLFKLGKTGEVSTLDILRKFKLVRTVLTVMEQRGWIERSKKNFYREPTRADLDRLSGQVARQYIRLIESAYKLFSNQGIVTLFVFQPILAEKGFPTSEENIALEKNHQWQPFIKQTYAKIRTLAKGLPKEIHFWDYSRLFENDKEGVYSDVIHYTEEGNAKIAHALAKDVGPFLVGEDIKESEAVS